MGTQESEGSGQVSMDDFKSLKSSMTTQISELHEMIAQLIQAKTPSAPPPEKPSLVDGKGEFPHW
jgi:hypothetical protein